MKKIPRLIILLLPVLFMAGCANNSNQMPPGVPPQAMSISDFLTQRAQFDGQSVTIRGVIKYKYNCPPCPEGAMCEPCAAPYFNMADPATGVSEGTEISVNVAGHNDVYAKIKTGESITVRVKFFLSGAGRISMVTNKNGYFYLESLVKN